MNIEWNPPRRKLIEFAWVALFGFPLIGLLFRSNEWIGDGTAIVIALLGPLVTLLASFDPRLVRPVYVGLMVVAAPIGFVIAHVLLGLIFYGLLTPVGLVFRLFGRDVLHRYPDPNAESYWHVRAKPRTPASYIRLY